ncbi:MAG TPA: 2-isopropylmalate synthase [Steroidobacteraceae bacterium]|nr:2-isopropylmalate synthase [Steroidobacteraceae bacterium]
MLRDPSVKYRPFPPVHLPERRWPSRQITAAPLWCSTDLRDGNQALFEPMNRETKKRFFQALVAVGLEHIEVGFPSASETDFATVRALIEESLIPEHVTPMVLTPAREELIVRTIESLRGARRAIVHVYNATAPTWRRVVFGLSTAEVMRLIERHVSLIKSLTDAQPETEWLLEYSPETFSLTELEVSLEACHTAMAAWRVAPGRPIILNLPTTVECATPNVFADQIEWMHTHLSQREHVTLSVHPHNDRGTGVAAAELALLAGAQRVEGCLFGNGERCGNVDLVTLALNLYTQGIDPGLDFSDINAIARVVEDATKLPIHPRHPYVGDLVFTAFSGSHQDAIKKGMAAQRPDAPWDVPYLPIDPADLGRTYDSVIRINSQSGKGGISYLLERDYGVVMPRRMQVDFSALVQRHVDQSETEMSAAELWALFEKTYFVAHGSAAPDATIVYHDHALFESGARQGIELDVTLFGQRRRLRGIGNGPIAATVNALGIDLRVDSYEERSLGHGADASALAIVEAAREGTAGSRFGAGRHANIVTASVLAVLSAVRRLGIDASEVGAPEARAG